jgi:hypothetical protein
MTKRMNFIERQQETLNAYIEGPLKDHFLSKEYIDGLCDQRNLLHSKMAKASASLFFLTTTLAFFDYFSGQTVTAFGVTVVIAPFFASVLSLITASAFFGTVSAFLDVLLIDAYLRTIGQSVGMFSFDLYTLNKTAINLWSSAITPKYFGPISSRSHHWAFTTIGLTTLVIMLVFVMFPTTVCSLIAWKFIHDQASSWTIFLFACASFILLLFTWLFILFFAMKYKFQPAHFNESNHAPTPDFVERMKAEQK